MAQRTMRQSWRRHLYHRVIAVQSKVVRRRAPQPGVLFRYPPYQSPAEEMVNGLTHGAAAVASAIGSIWLIASAVRHGDLLMVAGCAAYSASLTAVFTMSTLSHVLTLPRLRQLFRTLDQAAIYLLTAGSCTPYFIRYLLPHGWGWMLPLMWGLALAGVWSKLRGDGVNSVSLIFYVLLGWLPILAIKPMATHMPPGCLALVIAIGASYMLGVVFLMFDGRYRFFHAVWHVLVITASACTYAGVAIYVIP